MEFDHIGIVVKNIEKAIEFYSKFRNVKLLQGIELVESQGVRIAMFQEGTVKIEFIEPISDTSKVYNYLLKNPTGGMHHLCFSVKDIDETYSIHKSKLKCVVPKCIGHGNHKVAFFLLRDSSCGIRLIELME